MSNIFYFKSINPLGGTEQFLYEIAKKYSKYDITVYYDTADPKQIERLQKLVRCKRRTGEKVKCKKAFFNFNIDMIDEVEAEEYYFVSHAIYQELGYKPPIDNEKLTKIIAVSKYALEKIEEQKAKYNIDIPAMYSYNPITIEKPKRIVKLISASRLKDKTKGGDRTHKLIEALDRYCKEHGVLYTWTIFSDWTGQSPSENVMLRPPRLDVRDYIADSDYLVQLSNDMETYCYTMAEAWEYGVKVVRTPFTVAKEFKDSDKNSIVLDWDCGNIDDVVEEIFKPYDKFTYTAPKDNWDDILDHSKSTYKYDCIEVIAQVRFIDIETNIIRNIGDRFYCSKERATELGDFVCIVNTLEEKKKKT